MEVALQMKCTLDRKSAKATGLVPWVPDSPKKEIEAEISFLGKSGTGLALQERISQKDIHLYQWLSFCKWTALNNRLLKNPQKICSKTDRNDRKAKIVKEL